MIVYGLLVVGLIALIMIGMPVGFAAGVISAVGGALIFDGITTSEHDIVDFPAVAAGALDERAQHRCTEINGRERMQTACRPSRAGQALRTRPPLRARSR